MAIQIQFRRGTSTEWSNTGTANPILAQGEMGIETNTNLFKIGNGILHWNDLPYGGIQGYVGSRGIQGPLGPSIAVQNVLYVSKSGNDSYSGTTLNESKLTIRAAVAIATTGTTIFVKSGDYTEITPITVPKSVAIVGDNLRTVNVRATTSTNDIFYVNNAVYIANMTFKGHEAPAAAIAFPIDGSAGVISTSPYVQNCTSMTTDGTGMRVNGNHALGTKSMMVDAFTQYNQGGIGIHMLNSGYASLVSVFTICCNIGYLCESGGFCSITNSNSSFGNYALYADGVGAIRHAGKVVGATSGRTFVIDGLGTKPAIGDAVNFGDGDYYAVVSSTAFKTGSTDIVYPLSVVWDNSQYDAVLRNARQTILDEKAKLQILTINHILEAFPGFSFNQFKCSRDVGNIIDAISYDMVLNTNYQTIQAGSSYYRASGINTITTQKTQTINAIVFLQNKILASLTSGSTAYNRVNTLFVLLLDIVQNGYSVVPAITYNLPSISTSTTATNALKAVTIMQANKTLIQEETVGYISNFTYNTATCYRDTGLIVDSIAFDLLQGGTSQSVFSGLQYWSQTGLTGAIGRELTTTSAAIAYVRDQVIAISSATGGTVAATTVTNNFNKILYILNTGTSGISSQIVPNSTATTSTSTVAAYNAIVANASLLKVSTISWINSNYSNGFAYNQTKCSRDVGLIVDSAAFDLLYEGTSQSTFSGLQYWSQNIGYVGSVGAQLTTTSNAISYLKNLVVSNVTSAGGATVGTSVSNNFNTLLYIFNTGTVYLNYNRTTCRRDSDIILTGVAYDLAFGTNYNSVTAGSAYRRYTTSTNIVLDTELSQTLFAVNYLKTQTTQSLSTSTANANFTEISNIINGTTPSAIVFNNATARSSNALKAKNLLIANKTYIQTEIIAYILDYYPDLVYSSSKCFRDVGYVIDALCYDVMYGGNTGSRSVASSYYSGTLLIGGSEIIATTDAYNRLQSLVGQIVQGQTVTPSTTNSLTQIITNPASATEATELDSLVNIVKGVISSGNTNSLPAIIYPTTTSTSAKLLLAVKLAMIDGLIIEIDKNYDTGISSLIVPNGTRKTTPNIVSAYNSLVSAKASLQTQTLNWITTTNISFTFNTSTFYRDLGYIIDSTAFDLIHGGNRQSVMIGAYYYNFNSASTTIANQIAQTNAAYNYITTLTNKIIQGIAVTTLYQTTVTQTISVNTATSVEAALIVNKINTITNIISNGPSVVTSKIPISLTASTSTAVANAFTLLLANRSFIQAETVGYVNSLYSYNQETCSRDVGFILNSVAFDLLHGGNRQSVMSGVYYYGYNTDTTATVIANQIPQTTAAYNFIRDISSSIIKGNLITNPYQSTVTQTVSANTATSIEVGLINSKISTITNIIINGPSIAFPKVSIPLTESTNVSVKNAFNLLLANRTFIQAETVAFINTSYVGLVYSTATCKRDVGYIIDAVSYDLLYNGNSQTAKAGDAYYDGGVLRVPSGQKLATIAGYSRIKDIIDNVVLNTAFTPRYTALTQIVSYTTATSVESLRAQALVDIIANVVENEYSSTVVLQTAVPSTINDNTVVTFHQFSQIQSSSHNFEWIGAGINIDAALPFLGGEPNSDNYAIAINGGKVYYTATDQTGDFRIGNDLVINNSIGTISGRTFTKSLFAVMTPYILAIGG